MKKATLITGALIIVGSFIGSSTFANNTVANQNSKRDRVKTYKSQIIAYSWDTLPSYTGGLFIELTESEHEALVGMTDSERKAFLQSKWVDIPMESHDSISHKLIKQSDTESSLIIWLTQTDQEESVKNKLLTGSSGAIWVPSKPTAEENAERKARIAKKQAELLEIKKGKIQKKINAGESLTRLEKKFAKEQGLIYE